MIDYDEVCKMCLNNKNNMEDKCYNCPVKYQGLQADESGLVYEGLYPYDF